MTLPCRYLSISAPYASFKGLPYIFFALSELDWVWSMHETVGSYLCHWGVLPIVRVSLVDSIFRWHRTFGSWSRRWLCCKGGKRCRWPHTSCISWVPHCRNSWTASHILAFRSSTLDYCRAGPLFVNQKDFHRCYTSGSAAYMSKLLYRTAATENNSCPDYSESLYTPAGTPHQRSLLEIPHAVPRKYRRPH